MKYMKNEEAVSPVIGVILMVVITVIIAAVLAVFAFGVGAPTDSPTASMKITSIDASGTNDVVTVQHFGGDTIRIKDTKITVETLNADGAILDTMAFDLLPAATGTFAAGDTLSISTETVSLSVNGGTPLAVGTDYSVTGSINLAQAGTDSVRVTIIDTPSGGVLSKPAAKVT